MRWRWLILLAVAAPLLAQEMPRPTRPRAMEMPEGLRQDWRTRLTQIDRLIRMGSLGRAATMLDELEKSGAPGDQVLSLRISIAEAAGDREQVVELCRAGLVSHPGSQQLLRPLALALMVSGHSDSASVVVDELLIRSPNRITAATQMIQAWREAGRADRGLALCDSLRVERGDDLILRRPRARCLLALGRVEEGVAEIVAELSQNPLNLPMARTDLLAGVPNEQDVRRALSALAAPDESRHRGASALLRVDLLLRLGNDREAISVVTPYVSEPHAVREILRHVALLVRETPLEQDQKRRQAQWHWLLAILEMLTQSEAVEVGQRLRVFDLLATAAEDALVAGYLDRDPERAAQRIEEVLELVRVGSPGSTRLYSAQVLLARHTRDVLGDPKAAAQRLERLLLNLDFPLEGVSLCRLELGLSHLAAGDTTRARTVLTRLGRSSQFRDAAGHAHYHLARLDLAQGHWDTARERLSAVALANPRSNYANDALDLALLVAEEQARPNGDAALLEAYSVCIRGDLFGDESMQRGAYERLLARADPEAEADSPVVARARLELAELDYREGRFARAISLCAAVAADQPDGPYAARALLRQGAMLDRSGDYAQARHAWERLLAQYPTTLEAEDARQLIRDQP